MAKMAGPFLPLPGEVIKLLKVESNACFKYYVLMIAECFLETDEDTDGEWVGAYVHQSQREIIEKIGASSSYRLTIFPRWEKIELVKMRDGLVYITKSYKKGDDYYRENLIKQDLADLKRSQITTLKKQVVMEGVIGEMSGTIAHLLGLLSSREPGAAEPVQEKPIQIGKVSAPGQGFASALVEPETKDIPLHVKNKMVSIFYREIGQNRISGTVRGKAQVVFKSLLREGFSPYEIGLAIDWTLDPANTSQKIRSFGIIPTTISQAIEAMEAKAKREVVVQQKGRAEDAATVERKAETETRERLEAFKAEMADGDRAELADKALTELRTMGVYQESMITQILIGIQENKILLEKENLTDLAGNGD